MSIISFVSCGALVIIFVTNKVKRELFTDIDKFLFTLLKRSLIGRSTQS